MPEDHTKDGEQTMKRLTISEKVGGKWIGVNLHTFTGRPVRREVWESMEGSEIVGKLEKDGTVLAYVAGTEQLREFYKGRAPKVLSWPEAADMMDKARSELADGTIELPFLQEICKVFGGGEVQGISYE